ncbi:hypothetical protein Rcae01_02667 [Novipirellula caenicola]|uniref:Uncharacterized protein n=1 Tax=Novipirellula caenicola TaxID=1536901 RepID=A0ABP9VPZ3_9BACT
MSWPPWFNAVKHFVAELVKSFGGVLAVDRKPLTTSAPLKMHLQNANSGYGHWTHASGSAGTTRVNPSPSGSVA